MKMDGSGKACYQRQSGGGFVVFFPGGLSPSPLGLPSDDGITQEITQEHER
ncbi:MAG: hypothetical protein E6614_05480 [Bradyrhizobium sp.]|jgi:hypothetical protein|uniref:Uncharacterized protein n=1 Tax=Bradyrhizobium denitrificans TaxID=2734912 RepID=A0ABS5FZY3_9BRAD|nr:MULTISPECIES: hypothetical protein [Bradyrhizobium]MBR1134588.1 hypothetical protein [Bradyrhizobium denitrificans]MDU0953976.1 hypothetical protein [Bradyrhizobium sp.]MDU1491922.1 hypothetical protein [Bradyrhizobium sp.]MDU1541947.1 hypothetical protein [Bradyrhizobium sp.]MDU1672107.1 hypothetical protein [Bradyrhizobium sp.]